MTKYLILLAILIALYLYWKYQQTKSLPHHPDDIIERKGKETFWDANDFDLDSDGEDHNTEWEKKYTQQEELLNQKQAKITELTEQIKQLQTELANFQA